MNKPLDFESVNAAYVAEFGPWPDRTRGGIFPFVPNSPVKYAADRGMVQQYLQALQDAVADGVPLDIADFMRMCEPSKLHWPDEAGAATPGEPAHAERPRLRLAKALFNQRVTPGIVQEPLNWD